MDVATLKEQAERCRRLAKQADPFTHKIFRFRGQECPSEPTSICAALGVVGGAHRRSGRWYFHGHPICRQGRITGASLAGSRASHFRSNEKASTIVSGVCLNSLATTSRTVSVSSPNGLPA